MGAFLFSIHNRKIKLKRFPILILVNPKLNFQSELDFDYADSNSNENLITVPEGKFKKLISPENAKNSVEVNNLSKSLYFGKRESGSKTLR